MDNETINRLRKLKPDIEKYGLKRLRVFGSTVRDDFRTDSDVDLLVEFDETPSYFEIAEMQEKIELNLRRKVDIVFAHKLFPELKDSILKEAIDV
jgi:predicted nucleotidyltransferase